MSLDPDAPFTIAPSRPRAVRQAVVGAALLVVGTALALAGGGAVAVIAAVGGVAVAAVGLLGLRDRGPVLTADERGLAMRAFSGPDGIRTLAWDQVESLHVRRFGRQFRLLCVLPRDLAAERAWAGARATAVDRNVKRVGAPYSVNLVPAGLTDDEALAQLRALGAPPAN